MDTKVEGNDKESSKIEELQAEVERYAPGGKKNY
jgi:hypothetical protein